MSLIIGLNKYH